MKKINISRDDIAESMHNEFVFPRDGLNIVNDIIDIVIIGLLD